MKNLELKDLSFNELMEVQGGDCECSSAVKAIGGAFAAIGNYFDDLGNAIKRVNWFGVY